MSRSYREPWYTDGYKGSKRKQFFKRYANKRVRKEKLVCDGGYYRKVFDPWEIMDYRFIWSSSPVYRWSNGELVEIEKSPKWKVCRK